CSRFCSPGLGDIPRPRAGNRNHPAGPRLGVVRRDCRGALKGLAIGFRVVGALEDHVASRHAPNMEPPVLVPCHLQAQPIVVFVGPAGKNAPATGQFVFGHSRWWAHYFGGLNSRTIPNSWKPSRRYTPSPSAEAWSTPVR